MYHHFTPSNGSYFSKPDTIYYLEIDGIKYVYTLILRPYIGCDPKPLTTQIYKEIETRIHEILYKTRHEKIVMLHCLPHIIGIEDETGKLEKMIYHLCVHQWRVKGNFFQRMVAWKHYRSAKRAIELWIKNHPV